MAEELVLDPKVAGLFYWLFINEAGARKRAGCKGRRHNRCVIDAMVSPPPVTVAIPAGDHRSAAPRFRRCQPSQESVMWHQRTIRFWLIFLVIACVLPVTMAAGFLMTGALPLP